MIKRLSINLKGRKTLNCFDQKIENLFEMVKDIELDDQVLKYLKIFEKNKNLLVLSKTLCFPDPRTCMVCVSLSLPTA